MATWTRTLRAVGIGFGCLVLLSIILSVGSAVKNVDRIDAGALDREIRESLPLETPLSTVEDFLTKRQFQFHFDGSSKTIYAVARNMKGSWFLVGKSLTLQFHFDDAQRLKSIDSKVQYTGP